MAGAPQSERSGVPVGSVATWRRVRVGSMQPAKLGAVREALAAFADDVDVTGVVVESGVAEQPLGFSEIVRGARNRAHAARASGDSDLAVGIEDGLVVIDSLGGAVLNIGCAWLCNAERDSFGFSSGFSYPPACEGAAVDRREPIGELFDALWRDRQKTSPGGSSLAGPSGSGEGNIGRLTGGVLTRTEYGKQAVLCALVRFLHPDLYPAEPGAMLPECPKSVLEEPR